MSKPDKHAGQGGSYIRPKDGGPRELVERTKDAPRPGAPSVPAAAPAKAPAPSPARAKNLSLAPDAATADGAKPAKE